MDKRIYALIFLFFALIGFGVLFVLKNPRTENLTGASAPVATSTVSEPKRVSLMFVGDIMLSRLVGKQIAASGDWRYPFLHIASTTSAADITFANLETTISDRGKKIGSEFSFRSDPRVAQGLEYAGFDVVSIANNHIWDYAEDAFMDTQKYLKEAGIEYAGGGANYEDAHTPKIIERNGMKFSFLAYTNLLPKFFTKPGAAPASASYEDWERVVADIKNAKSEADVVVVSYHWGEEYQTKHNAEEERIAHATIDAGANLVIGSHPHVLQEIERYKEGLIAYSLGNFVFDQYFSKETMNSEILEVDFENAKIKSVKEIPIFIPKTSQPELIQR